MKAESAAFLEQADIILNRADRMLSARLYEESARVGYLACSQAYIFERTGESSKSHHGVQTEFFRLPKDDATIDQRLRRFLSEAYEFKSVAAYGVGPDAVTSSDEATAAIAEAKRFVRHFRGKVDASAG